MIVDVALPIPVTKTFSYRVPEMWEPFVNPFQRVRVPFRHGTQTGVIMNIATNEEGTLKEIVDLIDPFPLIDDALVDLSRWASQYYVTPIGLALKYILPPTLNLEPHLYLKINKSDSADTEDRTLKRAFTRYGKEIIFHYLAEGTATLFDKITHQPFTAITSRIERDKKPSGTLFIGSIEERIDYYMEIINHELTKGSNVLMLLPDYHVTGVFFKKIMARRFGEKVFWYGSNATVRTKMEAFFKARSAGGSLILGNKSAVFLPISNLSLIIAERYEEDEYRNEEGFKFNAGIVAIQRARSAGIPVVLGNASPSFEAYQYAEGESDFCITTKKWLLDDSIREKIVAHGVASSTAFIEEAISLAREGLERQERIAIFLPRRDYGSYLVCHSCKKPVQCPECDGALDYRKNPPQLACPLCDKTFPYEERCIHCGSNIIRFLRIGVEYMEEKLKEALPEADIIKITGNSLKDGIKRISKVSLETPTIIVGTQSISKLYGFHVDKLVLCGWEEMRRMSGYRSEEKMIQTLVNLIDALTPEVIYLFMERRHKIDIGPRFDMTEFYQEGLGKRKNAGFPPYGRSFIVEVIHRDKTAGERNVEKIKEIFRQDGFENAISGMLRSKRNGQNRWKIVVKGDEPLLPDILLKTMELRGVQVEPDPMNI